MIWIWLACASAPGERFEGLIQAPAPMTLPISGEEACVVRLKSTTYSRWVSDGTTSRITGPPIYAPGATLTVDGEVLALEGEHGDPMTPELGGQWRWDGTQTLPQSLKGWGHDGLVEALEGDPTLHTYDRAELRERYARCDEVTSVRAVRQGDTLQLVDPTPARSRNALAVMGGIFAGFGFLCVLPVVGLMIWGIRRAVKKGQP